MLRLCIEVARSRIVEKRLSEISRDDRSSGRGYCAVEQDEVGIPEVDVGVDEGSQGYTRAAHRCEERWYGDPVKRHEIQNSLDERKIYIYIYKYVLLSF